MATPDITSEIPEGTAASAASKPLYLRTIGIALFILFLLIGAAFRIQSARKWNELNGDENLFALTAREFAENSRLFYPVKYEFRAEVPYKVFASPATQHPPLYPLLGGLLAKAAGTLNTFVTLKILACTAGIGALLLVWAAGRRLSGEVAALVGLSFCSLAITMQFYSAKASVYMLLACTNLALLWLLNYLPKFTRVQSAMLGALCAAGLLLHSCMFASAAAVAILQLVSWRSWRTLHLPFAAGAFLLVMAPYFAWNYHHIKSPFSSYSTTYLLMINHLTTPALEDGKLIYHRVQKPTGDVVRMFAKSSLAASQLFAQHLWHILGPGVVLLNAVGLWALWGKKRMMLCAIVLLIVFQIAISSIVGIFRARFAVPILPLFYVLAGIGFAALFAGRWWARGIAAIMLLFGLGQFSLTLYIDAFKFYSEANPTAQATYEKMRKLMQQMDTQLKPGVMLGASKQLDGGLETNYWLKWPYVHGREMWGPKWTPMLAKDFDVQYVWCDRGTVARVQGWLPNYSPVLSNDEFVVLGLTTPPPAP